VLFKIDRFQGQEITVDSCIYRSVADKHTGIFMGSFVDIANKFEVSNGCKISNSCKISTTFGRNGAPYGTVLSGHPLLSGHVSKSGANEGGGGGGG
jgi:hypothetical protein